MSKATTETESNRVEVTLKQQEAFRFQLRTDMPEGWSMEVDEGPPIGGGEGPNPSRMLAAAVGHCLASSLLFCLQKSRNPINQGVAATVSATMGRNEDGRLRVEVLDVDIDLPEDAIDKESVRERCLGLFEDYCVVTASIRRGIPVNVRVSGEEIEHSDA